MDIKTLKTLLIDGDGVLWLANEPVSGLNSLFNALTARGIDWALLTNNATHLPETYIDKLGRFGVTARPDQVFTSSTVTARYLLDQFGPGSGVYVLGAPALVTVLRRSGLNACSGEERPDFPIAAVVVGLDRDVSYQRLTIATLLIRSGVPFIGTNPDKTIPIPEGLAPGAGTFIAAVQAATDVEPVIIGKPEPTMFEVALRYFGAEPGTTAMLGDRLETDILGAQRVGLGTIAVLTGVTTREEIDQSNYKPDFVFDSIAELANALDHA